MCLILFSFQEYADYPLVVAANRDEFFHRDTRPAQFWAEEGHPDLLAGKDLEKGGTWMGLTKGGRFAAVTNFRDPSDFTPNRLSRGELTTRYLNGQQSAYALFQQVRPEQKDYNGFNLMLGSAAALFHYSNKTGRLAKIAPGQHGLSNALLDTPWPKVHNGKEGMRAILQPRGGEPDEAALFRLLTSVEQAQDAALPKTGVPLDMERQLSARFINIPERNYGTRCSTILSLRADGQAHFTERRYDEQGNVVAEQAFSFQTETAGTPA